MAYIEEILNDPEFLQKLEQSESLEDMAKTCNEAGANVTVQELEAIMAQDTDGEISEEALDAVAGGAKSVAAQIWELFLRGKIRKLPRWFPKMPKGRGPFFPI